MDGVWIFHGAGGRFASGAFRERTIAEAWISEHQLEGVLTWYPLDMGVFEWAIKEGYFTPKNMQHESSEFIQRFTSASQPHVHFEADLD
jgi:hypothetical protein